MDGSRITADELATHAAGLRRLALRLVEDVAAAEDLVQQTLAVALERAPVQEHSIFPWLSRVLRNLALHRWRSDVSRRNREQTTARSERTPSSAELVERLELHRVVADEVLALAEPYRSAVLSLYFDEMSADDYAKSVGLSASTVRSHVSRGIEMLRRRLDARSHGDRTAWTSAMIALIRTKPSGSTAAAGAATSGSMFGWLFSKYAAGFVAIAGLAVLVVWLMRTPPSSVTEPVASKNTESTLLAVNSPTASEQRTSVTTPPESSAPNATSVANQDATLDVVVVSKRDGAPVANASVTLDKLTPGLSYVSPNLRANDSVNAKRERSTATTDASGHAAFNLTPNVDFRLRVHESDANGAAVLDVRASTSRQRMQQRVEVSALETSLMCGRIVSSKTRTPIENATVEVLPPGIGFGEPRDPSLATSSTVLHSDADGRFEIRLPAWTRRHLVVEAPNFVRAQAVIGSEYSDAGRALEIRLRNDGGTIKVRATDPSSPLIAKARVLARVDALLLSARDLKFDRDFQFTEPATWTAPFGADGLAELAGLPASVPISLSVFVDDVVQPVLPDAYQLAPSETKTVDVAFERGTLITGRVVDASNAPIADRAIWLVPGFATPMRMLTPYLEPVRRASSDADGRFRFENVSGGTWLVGLAPSSSSAETTAGSQFAALAQRVSIGPNQADAAIELTCFRDLYIRGHVIGVNGERVPQIAVEAGLEDGSYRESDTAASDGSFSIGPLVDGDYLISSGGSLGPYADAEPIRVHAGASDVELQAVLGSPLKLRFVDREGSLLRRVNCSWFRPTQTGGGVYAELGSAVDGTFESMGSLAPGEWTVNAFVRDGPLGFARVILPAGGPAPVTEIVLSPGGKLRLHYNGPQSVARCHVEIDGLVASAGAAVAGRATNMIVPAGKSTLMWCEGDDGPVHTLEIEIASGETKDVNFDPAH